MEIVYLINPAAIKDITNLSDNLSDKYIRSALREAQDIGLNQVLGTRLLERLYTLVSTGDIKNTENAKYKKLLDSHISYYLAYETITNVVVIASVKIDNAGAVTSEAEKTNGLELKDIFKIESYYRQKADFYKSRLQAYLRMEHDNFPELEYEDAYNTLAEIETAYTSTIFLGGKRGKKPYHPCYCKPAAHAPEPVKYTIKYYVDNVLYHTAKYREGQIIEWVEAPAKEGQRFNAWIYGNSDNWENIPGNMPAHDIDCYAHYNPVEGEQHYYTLRYRVADWCEDNQIDFNNMAYIPEPFEWLQCVEREYDPNSREGWAKLTHANLRADTEIKIQKFTGYDCLFMLDLSDFNNTILTDRLFMDCQTIREFTPPKGLIGIEGGYTFYNCQYLSTINFATAEGYRAYEPFAYPMTGVFCNCVSLTEILADNQPNMYSQDGNLYNVSDELMAARYSDVTIKDGCTAILSESLKARGLSALTIPSSVRTIEVYSISENSGLSDVYFGGTMQQWAEIYKPDVNTIFVDTNVSVIHCSDGDCPVDYAGGGSEEPAEHKIDIFIEWDYLESRWFKVGERIELPEPPHREGYTFVSWNAIVPGGDWLDAMPEFMPDYDFEVHASYTANTYKLTYKVDGEIVSETDVEYGAGIVAMEEPVKEGHTFSGWSEIPETMPAHDVEVTGSFTANSYTVTFYVDEEEYHKETVTYLDIIPLPTEPTKEGYTFSHWYGDLHYPTRMPSHDIDTHAVFDINSYKITYVAGDWSEEATYKYGDTINEKTAPVKEGYSFLYWDELPATMPAKDITVSAVYERNEYKITYMIDGVPYNEVRYYFEDEVQPYVPAVDEGYVFNGWDNEPTVMPAHDVVVTGSITKVEEPEGTPYERQYLTIERTDNDVFNYALTYSDWTESCDMSYSVDDGATWTRFNQASNSLSMKDYRKIMFKATTNTDNTSKPKGTFQFSGGGRCIIYGNIMSLVYGDDFVGKTDLKVNFEFAYLFNQVYVTDASNLILPSTTLVKNCYNYMFRNCSRLTEPPTLPATTLADYCYSSMFYGCTSLTTPPELPATKLAPYCYESMFEGCTGLTTAPVLPATTMANSCYSSMFKRCTSLTAAPVLPATTMDASCYSSMFYGCTSLTTPPQISATTVGVKVGVFQGMFEGCTSLTKSPVLKVKSLQQNSYYNLFKGCTNLSEVTMLATSVSAKYCLSNWMNDVASTGTFYKSPNMPLETIQQHVPSGWTVENAVV